MSALLRKTALLAGMTAVSLTTAVAAAAPAQAACSTNVYRVTQTTGLFDYGTFQWLRDKHRGDGVTGPNSNVMDNLYGADWRVVYKGGGGLGLIWKGHLDYQYCVR